MHLSLIIQIKDKENVESFWFIKSVWTDSHSALDLADKSNRNANTANNFIWYL